MGPREGVLGFLSVEGEAGNRDTKRATPLVLMGLLRLGQGSGGVWSGRLLAVKGEQEAIHRG